MAKSFAEIEINYRTRLCTVLDELGYFHCWEQYSQPVEASPLVGGAPAGVIAQTFGIVEFRDGVRRVQPYLIKFCDEEKAILNDMAKRYKEMKENEQVPEDL